MYQNKILKTVKTTINVILLIQMDVLSHDQSLFICRYYATKLGTVT